MGGGHRGDWWEDRWRNQKDRDISRLQRDYIEMGKTVVEVREWIKDHDTRHEASSTARARIPEDVRGWISTAISIFTLLLMLYLQSQH